MQSSWASRAGASSWDDEAETDGFLPADRRSRRVQRQGKLAQAESSLARVLYVVASAPAALHTASARLNSNYARSQTIVQR